ncbi:type 1 glutamine amidotransferase domain-containing protein [Polyangium aurulentum]|uniref:type 1 glutamine amidotransferase domain-containing protein n=1 Tax=Polyangium aurulentum TaxID=2567896 RepID=UPI0010AEB18E|nr:type 1 glutamine amidotransferase domain-containing protein [Polyangium aurulentum]UQA62620.1 type 1 glutamine amidotransferase domain-containing protein [Polyangium aurulentum]
MSTTSKKILFVLTSHDRKGDQPSGYFLPEVTHPHHVLTGAGFSVEFVSPKGGKAPVDPDSLDLRDPINAAFWNDTSLRHAVESTRKPSEVDANEYAAIFFAGGHGAMWDLPDSVELAELAARIYERGGVVAAVCHGPAGLVNIKLSDGSHLVAGKDVAAFTNDEERAVKLDAVVPFLLVDRLVERGARHQAAPNWQSKVVVSERLVTGQNPASATGVGEAMAALLGGDRSATRES